MGRRGKMRYFNIRIHELALVISKIKAENNATQHLRVCLVVDK